jgi:hypothetical protein
VATHDERHRDPLNNLRHANFYIKYFRNHRPADADIVLHTVQQNRESLCNEKLLAEVLFRVVTLSSFLVKEEIL